MVRNRQWLTAGFFALLTIGCDADAIEGETVEDTYAGKADVVDEGSERAGGVCGDGVVDEGEDCDGSPCCTDECTFVETDRPIVELPASMGGGGTYPRATLLSDGRLVGAYEHGAPGRAVLSSVESLDGGASWSKIGVIASEPATPGRSLANPHVVELPDGTLLTAFRHHDPGANGNTNYRLLVSASTNGGRSWQFRGEIEVYGHPKYGIWEPFLFVTPQGRLQAYYAKEREGMLQDIVVRDSTNGGASWGPARLVARAAGSRDGMAGVTALKDGSLVAIFEAFRQPGVNNNFVVRTVQSNDDGRTWHHRQLVFAPGNGARHAGAPQISTLADGRLVASFMTDSQTAGGKWPGRAETYIMVSENVPSFGNIRWSPQPIVAASSQSFWPGLVQGPLRNPIVTVAKDGKVQSVAICLP